MILNITVMPLDGGFKVSASLLTPDEDYVSSLTLPELIIGDDWGGNPTLPVPLQEFLVETINEFDDVVREYETEGEEYNG